MTSHLPKPPMNLKDSLFSGEIAFEQFMSEYFNKKPCVLGKEGSAFEGYADGEAINRLMANSGRLDLKEPPFIFYLPEDEKSMKLSELYTQEMAVEQRRTKYKPLEYGHAMEYVNYNPTLKAHMVRQFFMLGGSLRMFYPHEFNKRLAMMMKGFEDVFQAKFGSSLFYHFISDERSITPHHYDYEDFFAVQMKGQKRWVLTKRIANNARRELIHQVEVSGEYEALYNEVQKEVVMDFVLKPGQVLYVPASYGHKVHPSGEYEDEVLHITFMMLSHLTMDNFRDWQKKTQHRFNDPEMEKLDLSDLDASLEKINRLKWQATCEELALFKRFVEDNSYSNTSDGFLPQLSIAQKIAQGGEQYASYCPIFAPRYEKNEDGVIMFVNTERFELEHETAFCYITLLESLFEAKHCQLKVLMELFEPAHKEAAIEAIQALYDNGVINVA